MRQRRRARRDLERFADSERERIERGATNGDADVRAEVSELRFSRGTSPAIVNDAVARVSTRYVVIAEAGARPLGDHAATRLARAAVEASAVVMTARTVHPIRRGVAATPFDGCVRACGLEVQTDEHDRPVAVAIDAGAALSPSAVGASAPAIARVDAAGFGFVAVERARFAALGGLRGDDLDAAFVDLSLRAGAGGGLVAVDPSTVVVDHRPVRTRWELTVPLDPDGAAWRWIVCQHGAALHRLRAPTLAPLRVAITCAAPSARAAPRWGDWHLAEALGRALARTGARVHLATLDRADDAAVRASDVDIVVRGLEPVEPSRGQRQVLWIISHPESLTDAELARADLVLCASATYAPVLRARTATPVEVVLQATDSERFSPAARGREHAGGDVVVVAKTRGVARRAVVDAEAAGLRPTIYGSGWRDVVAPGQIAAEHVANADLAAVYANAAVVLNDHWDSMRDLGFVSNRIFDVLACGTPVVSDPVAGLDDLFGDLVPTWHSPDDLGAIVRAILADPGPARAAAARARELVLAHHTFDHRATEILAAVRRHGLVAADG